MTNFSVPFPVEESCKCPGSSEPSTGSSSWLRRLASLASSQLPGGIPLSLECFYISTFPSSIPNPLFDLAGITCGHFLVPFWTFFGATLIGKAVIKMHIQVGDDQQNRRGPGLIFFFFQKVFVILAFNKELFEGAVSLLVQIPVLGKTMFETLLFNDYEEESLKKGLKRKHFRIPA